MGGGGGGGGEDLKVYPSSHPLYHSIIWSGYPGFILFFVIFMIHSNDS